MDYYKLKVLNNKKIVFIIIGILIIIALLLYYFLVYQKDDDVIPNDLIVTEEENISNESEIIVDIKGHIAKPGIYKFNNSDNARVNDLIVKAGGLLKDADTSTINLSKKLEDEMIIIIYSKNEITNYTKTIEDLKTKLELCEKKPKNDACITVSPEASNSKININEASVEELETLSGIGKSKAEAIIEYRKKNKFKSIDEIMNVDGIGESIFANIKENITV